MLKSTTAHIFHVGDSRVYLIRDNAMHCLTNDHRLLVDRNKACLARAMGGEPEVHYDYRKLPMQRGDIFLLSSDGVHDFLDDDQLKTIALSAEPEPAAAAVVNAALDGGSNDTLTCQILRIEQLPNQDENAYYQQLTQLPFPPPLEAGMVLDGYRIVRELHASATIQIYLAEDIDSGETVVLKTPSVNFEDDPAYIDRFLHEEWVGRRIDSPHVFKVHHLKRPRSCIYYVTEYLEGGSLAQWMLDHPEPDLDEVRNITAQIIKGLRAFHRRDMVHQDIKPENIMIDRHHTVKIIDFGSTQVAGLQEVYTPIAQQMIGGTANYIAPELFDGYQATPKSDLFSLGVTVYAMLSGGKLPYGKQESAKRRKRYDYISLRKYNLHVPIWMDGAIRKAVDPNPDKRYEVMSEFFADLTTPNPALMRTHAPLLERDPVRFWRGLSIILIITNLLLLYFINSC